MLIEEGPVGSSSGSCQADRMTRADKKGLFLNLMTKLPFAIISLFHCLLVYCPCHQLQTKPMRMGTLPALLNPLCLLSSAHVKCSINFC